MNPLILNIVIAVSAVLASGGITFIAMRPKVKAWKESSEKEAQRIINEAEREAERDREKNNKILQTMKDNANREIEKTQERIDRMQSVSEERITKREENLETKNEKLEQVKSQYQDLIESTEQKNKKLEQKISEETEVLSKLSGLSKESAKEELFKKIEVQCSSELGVSMQRRIEQMKNDADLEAGNFIVKSIQRYASSTTTENTTSVVKLESDDIKGKIIGREGRNINAFERLTGVDLIVDDTPGTITISSFDPFRRYVAKISLESLIRDGRIHPSRIEGAIEKAEKEAEKLIFNLGKKACQEIGMVSFFPEPILKLLGRLRFRTSYGQNVLRHSIEVAFIGEALAQEIKGADPEIMKKAGLLHDIGKAVSHEIEGGHAVIGKDILEKFGIDKRIIDAMKSHHEDFPYESNEARLLQAADAISASRPGARREAMDKYIKRLKELEAIAGSFKGVSNVYAIQAGRELRIFVDAEQINDLEAEKMSFEIARKIEKNCEYPGEVCVSLIRENKFKSVAK